MFVCAEVASVFVPNKNIGLVDEGFHKVHGKESIKAKDLRNMLFHAQSKGMLRTLKENDIVASEAEVIELHRRVTRFAAEVEVNGKPLSFRMTEEQERWCKFIHLLFGLVTVWKSGEQQREELESIVERVDVEKKRQSWMEREELLAIKHNGRIYKRYKLLFYTKSPKCIEGEGLDQERKQQIQTAFKRFYRDPVANAIETPFEPIKINTKSDEIPARQNCRDFNYNVYDAREKQLEQFFPLDVRRGFGSFFSCLKALRGFLKLKPEPGASSDAVLNAKFDQLRVYLSLFPRVVDVVEAATTSSRLSPSLATILGSSSSFADAVGAARAFTSQL